MFKFIFTQLLALTTLFVILSVPVSAAQIFPNCGQGSASGQPTVCHDVVSGQSQNSNPILVILKDVVTVLSYAVGVIAIIGILISGFRMIIANGDSNAVASARNGLLYSIIGVAVAVSAQAIVLILLGNVK